MGAKTPHTEPRGARPATSFVENPLEHVRSLYAVFLQGIFYSRQPGFHHWSPNEDVTEISVRGESPLHTETIGDRPTLSLTRAPVSFSQLGFDDMLRYDPTTGRKVKSLLIPGTMIINCCSKNDLESEHLAWIAGEHIWLMRDILMRQGFYDIGRNIQIGSPSQAEGIVVGDGAEEWFATSVTSPFFFHRTSSFQPLNRPMLRELDVRLRMPAAVPLQQGIPSQGAGGLVDPPWQKDVFPPPPFAPGAGNPNIRTETNLAGLPIVPHPLNPDVMVVLRPMRADQPGLRPPSINGRVLPIASPAVEQSEDTTDTTVTVKI